MSTNTNAQDTLKRILPQGALFGVFDHGTFALGAFEVAGDRFIWAEVNANHQGQVHLVRDATLEVYAPTMVNVYSDGALYGTIEQMDDGDRRDNRHQDWLAQLDSPSGSAWLDFVREIFHDLKKG